MLTVLLCCAVLVTSHSHAKDGKRQTERLRLRNRQSVLRLEETLNHELVSHKQHQAALHTFASLLETSAAISASAKAEVRAKLEQFNLLQGKGTTPPMSFADCTKFFFVLDKDKKGLDYTEFSKFFGATAGMSEANMVEFWKQIDVDGTSIITVAEFTNVCLCSLSYPFFSFVVCPCNALTQTHYPPDSARCDCIGCLVCHLLTCLVVCLRWHPTAVFLPPRRRQPANDGLYEGGPGSR